MQGGFQQEGYRGIIKATTINLEALKVGIGWQQRSQQVPRRRNVLREEEEKKKQTKTQLEEEPSKIDGYDGNPRWEIRKREKLYASSQMDL